MSQLLTERIPASEGLPSLPFLKWAGGKRRSMNILQQYLPSPDEVECLVEPFVGGGSVFLGTRYRRYLLADVNADLIDMYIHVRDDPRWMINQLNKLYVSGNNVLAYNRNRNAFNVMKTSPEKSALFIYLNQHCFNGICRYNQQGIFNVPFGKRKTAYLPAPEIMAFAEKTARCHVTFLHAGFADTLEMMKNGTFSAVKSAVYCDPPYLPTSQTASFTTYNGETFTEREHQQLVRQLTSLHREAGTPVVISASDTSLSYQIYGKAGFRIYSHEVARSISARPMSRLFTRELTGVLTARHV
ncbi:DNA adenine methylase [Salmonella enterica subsp. enterica serovar Newport]|nr:DNA adenine methylase [Salmonella enterica subsp. enterica serovar Newport]